LPTFVRTFKFIVKLFTVRIEYWKKLDIMDGN
jgi:hypothetical protein